MRDGVRLRADVYSPAGPGPHPVLLMRAPYSKDWAQTVVYAHPYWYASRGYIVVVQDARGRCASDGEFTPWVDEATDGYDTIEWAAELPGSSGKVGMYGFSYAGAAQLQAAALRPPHLRAIAPAFASIDFYGDWIYPGGALSWAFMASWGVSDLAAESARRLGAVDLQEQLLASLRDLPGSYWHLPVSEYPHLPESAAPWFHEWLAHPARDRFWQRQDGAGSLSDVAVPGLHFGGWSDIFIRGTLATFGALVAAGVRDQRLVIGPWMHMPWIPWSPPEAGGADRIGGVDALQLEWFDRWLEPAGRDRRTADAADPDDPVRVFVMGADRWKRFASWPPAEAESAQWYLHSDGRANSRFGDGELRRDQPGDEECDAFVYEPRNPVPSVGGRSCCDPDLAPIGFADQRTVEVRNDVLVYSSGILEAPLEIHGAVTVVLWAASSAVDTDFTGKLVDVHPDGTALNVVDGIVRARHRRPDGPELLLEPDTVNRFEIALGSISWEFAAGHRLRLEVSSSNFPRYSRNANSAVHPNRARFGDLQPALQRVFHDAARPSALVLPAAI
jgi:putative CocE/NonD family hydrolase